MHKNQIRNSFNIWNILTWSLIIVIGIVAFVTIAIARNETINSVWIITAAACIYLVSYRFYSSFIASKVLGIDPSRKTPAFKFQNGRDYEPTNRWVVFGHHFAAIAGAGPLIGPTLAAQFGYLPGTLWILVGAVCGGCIQDMVILFFSVRRNGKSLSGMAKDELGIIGGIAAMIGTLMIVIILIAVLGLIVVNAMKHSPWATSTVFATIPIAILVGVYMRFVRPGAVLEASIIGIFLLLLSVFVGKYVQNNDVLRHFFDYDAKSLVWLMMGYGFAAAVLPVWLLLAPRDYLSTFLKLGTIALLAISIIILHPEIKMPAVTKFVDGTGPIFGGKIFPFLFITLACGAISGFHSLIASGTTPKLISNERDIRMVGYGSMILESAVAIMAMIAATIMEPGIFFAINSPVGVVGSIPSEIVATINSWGFSVTADQMKELAAQVGETTLFNRTGGAPSLAVGMASIFSSTFGNSLLSMWYHFVIMFEAIFILTTVDAGTRVCRFMIQEMFGNVYKPLGRTSWYPSVFVSSFIAVAAWGYLLYAGVIDPNGGINMLWPLFGLAGQILAVIAFTTATCIILSSKKAKYFWITAVPLLWLTILTMTTAWQKLTSDDVRIGIFASIRDMKQKLAAGLLSEDQIAIVDQLIFNQYVVAFLVIVLASIVPIVVIDMLRVVCKRSGGKS